jgi:hypothetical protein
MDQDVRLVLDAYRDAWKVRQSTGRSDTELLFELIGERDGLEMWIENPVGRELLVKKWTAGVPPWRLRVSLLREVPALLYGATVKPAVAIYRSFREES